MVSPLRPVTDWPLWPPELSVSVSALLCKHNNVFDHLSSPLTERVHFKRWLSTYQVWLYDTHDGVLLIVWFYYYVEHTRAPRFASEQRSDSTKRKNRDLIHLPQWLWLRAHNCTSKHAYYCSYPEWDRDTGKQYRTRRHTHTHTQRWLYLKSGGKKMLIYPIPHCRFILAGMWHWLISLCKMKYVMVQRGRQRKEPEVMRWSLNLGGKTLRLWLNYVRETAQAFWSCGTIRIPHPSKITSAPITLQCAV